MENKIFVIQDLERKAFLCFNGKMQIQYYLGIDITKYTLRFANEHQAKLYLDDMSKVKNIYLDHFKLTVVKLDPIMFAIKSETPLEPIEMKNENTGNFIIYHPKSNEVVNWNNDPNGFTYYILGSPTPNVMRFNEYNEALKCLNELSVKNPFFKGCEVILIKDYDNSQFQKPKENLLDFDQDDMPAPVKPKQKRNIIVSFDHHFWTPLKMSFKPMHYLLMTFAALAILTGYNSELLFILIIICSTIACIFLLNAVIHFITFRSIDNYLFGLMNYLIKIQVNATKRRK